MSARSRRSGRTILFHPDWAAEIWLALTPGNETDFEEIKTDVRRLCSRFQIMSVGYDPWQSTQMSQRLRAEGVPMHEFRATMQNFSLRSLSSTQQCGLAGCVMMATRC